MEDRLVIFNISRESVDLRKGVGENKYAGSKRKNSTNFVGCYDSWVLLFHGIVGLF